MISFRFQFCFPDPKISFLVISTYKRIKNGGEPQKTKKGQMLGEGEWKEYTSMIFPVWKRFLYFLPL